MKKHLTAVAAAAVVAMSANAASITGEYVGASDALNGSGFNGTYDAAKAAFQGAIAGATFGSDSLEGALPIGLPAGLTYGSTGVTGTLSASGSFLTAPFITNVDPQSQQGPNGPSGAFARQATDGENFLYTALSSNDSGALNLTFNPETVVRGFGFSVTDLGDFGASVSIAFFDGTVQTLSLSSGNYGLVDGDFENGDHIWASFTTDEAIASVSINLIGGTSGDAFSFDEFSVLVVPVPPAAAMAGLGLLGVALRRRKMIAG